LSPVWVAALSASAAFVAIAVALLSRRQVLRARRLSALAPAEEGMAWSFGPREVAESAEPEAGESRAGAPEASEPEASEPEAGQSTSLSDSSQVMASTPLAAGAREPSAEGVRGGLGAASEPASGQASGAIEPSEAALLELLDDDRVSVRRGAVTALAGGHGADALCGLSYAVLRDPCADVRREAIVGLRSLVGRRHSVGSPRAEGEGPVHEGS
jgi:hypothetical protein